LPVTGFLRGPRLQMVALRRGCDEPAIVRDGSAKHGVSQSHHVRRVTPFAPAVNRAIGASAGEKRVDRDAAPRYRKAIRAAEYQFFHSHFPLNEFAARDALASSLLISKKRRWLSIKLEMMAGVRRAKRVHGHRERPRVPAIARLLGITRRYAPPTGAASCMCVMESTIFSEGWRNRGKVMRPPVEYALAAACIVAAFAVLWFGIKLLTA
jgi:hypothetical protein